MRTIVVALLVMGCGRPELPEPQPSAPADAGTTTNGDAGAAGGSVDAGLVDGGAGDGELDAGATDSGLSADAGRLPRDAGLTYEAHIQPLLSQKCDRCHGNPVAPQFYTRYSVMLEPTTLCEQDAGIVIGQCIGQALAAQVPEGTYCRTVTRPFHRSGWQCLTPAEIQMVHDWIADGMPER